ncbi:MAG: Nuclease (SNase domain protein) [Desulfonauticus sp. 38_4375]|nr:MAG: Nuclease (SNase domain protein) [Desulfonauticus sp. 38_4375]
MKAKKPRRASFFWSLALILFFPCFSFAQTIWVFPRFAIDGDTLFLSNGLKLRLKSIDAPELGHGKGKDQYFAREAKYFLFKLVKGKKLKLEEVEKDRFGRIIAQVYTADGNWINREMLAQGFAFYFEHKGVFYPRLLKAQQEAMRLRKGFWAKLLELPLARRSYLGNSYSRRFHQLSCPNGQLISSRHKRLFFSLYEAFYKGYAPARGCTPWPLVD